MAEYTGNGYKDESVENKNAVSSPQVKLIHEIQIILRTVVVIFKLLTNQLSYASCL